MPKISLYNMSGKEVGEIELSDKLFGAEINKTVMHMAVVSYLANQRQGTQSTLTRSEVAGGGRKPWRQKGTGRARQGSIRAPQWIHGGIVFAPKPRDYRITMNKKVKRNALFSALSSKVIENNIFVVDLIALEAIKTKSIAEMLKAFNITGKALIITADTNENIVKSARNIENIRTATATTLSTYEVIKYDTLIIAKDAVLKLEEVYA